MMPALKSLESPASMPSAGRPRWIVSLTVALGLVISAAQAEAQSPQAQAAFDEGLSFKKAKDYNAALGAFQRATQLDPSYEAAWAETGNSQLSLGQAEAAGQSFTKALELQPANQTARYNLAYALRQQKRFDEAAKQYQLYLQRSPNDADAHYGLAESLKAAGAHLAAAEAYEAYARTEKRATWSKWITKAKQEAADLRRMADAQPVTAPTVSTAPVVAAAAPSKLSAPAPAPAADKATLNKDSKLHLSFSAGGAAAQPAPESTPAPTPVATPAVARRPEAFEAGLNQLKAGDFEGALVRLKVAQTEAPEDSMVWAAVAGAHLGLRDGPNAEAAYRRALTGAVPEAQAALHLGLGEALRVQGEDEAANQEYVMGAEHPNASAAIQRLCKERLAAR